MDNKNLSVEERVKSLIESFAEKTPKQMRTIRNNLNNRIRSFEEEMKYGKTLPKVSASHMFYEFDLKDCKKVLDAAMKQLKTLK
jgi:hypothetical protein